MESELPLSATEIAFQKQIDLLQAVIKEQMTALKTAMKQIEELRCINESQAKEIIQLKDEIRRLKDLKTKPKIRPSKMNNKGPSTGSGGKRSGSKKKEKLKI